MSWVLWYLGIGLFLGLIRGVLRKSFWGVPVLMALWLPFLLAIVAVAVLFLLVDSLQADDYKETEEDVDGRNQQTPPHR